MTNSTAKPNTPTAPTIFLAGLLVGIFLFAFLANEKESVIAEVQQNGTPAEIVVREITPEMRCDSVEEFLRNMKKISTGSTILCLYPPIND